MLEVVVDTENLSQATRAVLELPGLFARARASALKSLGWTLQQELKNEARKATKGGYLKWEPLHPHTGVLNRANRSKERLSWKRTRFTSGARKGQVIPRLSAMREPLGRMRSSIRYKVDVEDDFVEVGFIDPQDKYYKWVRKQAQGYTVPVTRRMRKKFFALGFPLAKGTTQLKVPGRPWVSRVEDEWRGKMIPFFEEKFWSSYNRYQTGAAKA
jgi:hypothetical protein